MNEKNENFGVSNELYDFGQTRNTRNQSFKSIDVTHLFLFLSLFIRKEIQNIKSPKYPFTQSTAISFLS